MIKKGHGKQSEAIYMKYLYHSVTTAQIGHTFTWSAVQNRGSLTKIHFSTTNFSKYTAQTGLLHL